MVFPFTFDAMLMLRTLASCCASRRNPSMKHHKSVAEAHQYIVRAPDWTNGPQKITISGQHIALGTFGYLAIP